MILTKYNIRVYPIPGFPGYYAVQDGRIWSAPKKYGFRNGGFLTPDVVITGHLRVTLWKNKKMYRRFVHRLILETFIGPCPAKMETCHNNGLPTDNRLCNLRWDTRSNNHRDAFKHGVRDVHGEKHPGAKLNNKKVKHIRKLIAANKLFNREIGNIFGVTSETIRAIESGRSWTHI